MLKSLSRVLLSASMAMLVGCAHSPPKQASSDSLGSLYVQLAGKTAVFSLKGSAEEKRRVEQAVVAQMKKLGYDSAEGRPHLPNLSACSAQDVANFLLRSGFKSIAEVAYTGDLPKSGLPKHVQLNLHTLSARQESKSFKLKANIETALATLMAVSLQFGSQQLTL